MGRVNFEDVDKYKTVSGAPFFGLENDKDVATVRFCHQTTSDVEIIACHEIELDGKRRKVSCLRSYDDPTDVCPLCASGRYQTQIKYFLHVLEYKKDRNGFTGEVEKKVWERGRSFQKDLLGLNARYNPLCDTVFEIERQGKKGDTQTKYGIYPMNYTLEELPIDDEMLNNDSVIGSIVLDKTAEELDYFLETNEFPPTGNDAEAPIERRPAPAARPEPVEAVSRREVPSNNNISRRRI